MSDNEFLLIPTDAYWLPDAEAVVRATAAFSRLVPDVDDIAAELYDTARFVDPGGNLERVCCPACRSELDMDWWSERMSIAYAAEFSSLEVTTPCCSVRSSLNDLAYDWPAGFARAALRARNPSRGWLDDTELATVADQLGHPLRQVMRHI